MKGNFSVSLRMHICFHFQVHRYDNYERKAWMSAKKWPNCPLPHFISFFFFNPPPSFVALPCAACLQYMGKKSSAGILVGHKTEEQNSKLEQLPIIRSTVAKGYTSFSQTNKTLNIDNGPWCTLHYFFMLMLCGPVPKVLHSDRVESGRLCR